MKHNIGTKVRVISLTDQMGDTTFIGKEGIVERHNDNEITGNTIDDPLHMVKFEDGTVEGFWYEELKPVKLLTKMKTIIKEKIAKW